MKTANNLAKKVAERKKFLRKVLKFAVDIVMERGKVISRNVKSSNIHIVYRLDDFGKFSFVGNFGQTMFGGNNIEIWQNSTGNPVLSVYFQSTMSDSDEWVVNLFDESFNWQNDIIGVIRRKEAIIKEMAMASKKLEAERKRDLRRKESLSKLNKQAKRLGLTE